MLPRSLPAVALALPLALALTMALVLAGCAPGPTPPAVRDVAIDGGTDVAIGLHDAAVQAEPGQVVRIHNANQGPAGRAAAESDRPGSVVHVLVAGPPGPLFTDTPAGVVPTPSLWAPCIGTAPTLDAPCTDGPGSRAWDGRARLSTGAIPAGGTVDVRLADDVPSGERRLVCVLHPQLSLTVLVTDRATADPAAARPPDPVPVDGAVDRSVPPATVLVGPDDGAVAAGLLVPSQLQVRVGEPVRWLASGPAPHQVTLSGASAGALPPGPTPGLPAGTPHGSGVTTWDGVGEVGSGWLSTDPSAPGGAAWTIAVTTPGTYRMRCLIHPSMEGRLVVR